MNRRQWWQCVAVAVVSVLVSAAMICSADEPSAKAAQLICDTAIKAAGEARAEAVERCHANGITDPYTVAIFQQAENHLTFGAHPIIPALTWQKNGDTAFKQNKWSQAELCYLVGWQEALVAYDLFRLVYPGEPDPPNEMGPKTQADAFAVWQLAAQNYKEMIDERTAARNRAGINNPFTDSDYLDGYTHSRLGYEEMELGDAVYQDGPDQDFDSAYMHYDEARYQFGWAKLHYKWSWPQ